MPADLITVAQAAELLGIPARTVRLHITSGRLPAIAVNDRLYLLQRKDVEAFTPPARGRPAAKPKGRRKR